MIKKKSYAGKRLTFCYTEGWEAQKEGKTLTENPYDSGTKWVDWSEGWLGRVAYLVALERIK